MFALEFNKSFHSQCIYTAQHVLFFVVAQVVVRFIDDDYMRKRILLPSRRTCNDQLSKSKMVKAKVIASFLCTYGV